MEILITIIHIVVCLVLIMIVLLQMGKGADMGAAFGGGGSNTLFGSTGASTFLGKVTVGVAVVFMVTCLILAYMSAHTIGSSVVEDIEAPAETSAPVNTIPDSEAPPIEATAPASAVQGSKALPIETE